MQSASSSLHLSSPPPLHFPVTSHDSPNTAFPSQIFADSQLYICEVHLKHLENQTPIFKFRGTTQREPGCCGFWWMQLRSGVFALDGDLRPLLVAPEVEEGGGGGGRGDLSGLCWFSLFSSHLPGASTSQHHSPPPWCISLLLILNIFSPTSSLYSLLLLFPVSCIQLPLNIFTTFKTLFTVWGGNAQALRVFYELPAHWHFPPLFAVWVVHFGLSKTLCPQKDSYLTHTAELSTVLSWQLGSVWKQSAAVCPLDRGITHPTNRNKLHLFYSDVNWKITKWWQGKHPLSLKTQKKNDASEHL